MGRKGGITYGSLFIYLFIFSLKGQVEIEFPTQRITRSSDWDILPHLSLLKHFLSKRLRMWFCFDSWIMEEDFFFFLLQQVQSTLYNSLFHWLWYQFGLPTSNSQHILRCPLSSMEGVASHLWNADTNVLKIKKKLKCTAMNNLKCEIMTELTGGSPAQEKSGRPYNNTWSRQDFGGSDSPTCSQFTTLTYIFPTVNLSRLQFGPFFPPLVS